MPDFFISHADDDLEWAEWIAAELENAGYGVSVKAWDFRPGENLLARHNEALATSAHTICVLTKSYLDSEVATSTAAHLQALQGKERALIPVRVAACTVPPLMAPIIAIDLSEVAEEDEARRRLLGGLAGRAERVARGRFPRSRATRARFPNASQETWELRGHRHDPYFIGRGEDLSALHRAFRTTSAVQVVSGLGGLGKTRLAVEYAIRYAAAYDLVWWIRAEDPATMRGDYVELAQELGLPCEKDDQAIAALRRELRRRRDWLLILDNAEDPDEVFPLLPDRHSGHVLITSRRREWPHAETCRLDVLPTDVAAEYLQQKGRVTDPGVARELADALGGLPLALVQAASVIATSMSAADYLDLLYKQSPGLFAAGRTPDHELTIDSTWRVSVDRLTGRSLAAVALFRVAAFLAADAIPLFRLTATAQMPPELTAVLADRLELGQAVAALGEYSLAETADGLLSIHRVVQAVIRSELGADAPYWAGIALAAIAAAFPGNVQDPKAWPVCEEVLAHVLICCGHAFELRVDTMATVQLLNRAAQYLLARGRLDSAEAVLNQALASAGALEQDHPAYLSCRNTYGQLLLARGEYPASWAVHEDVYKSMSRVLGPDHPDTLSAGRDLVHALYWDGRQVRAAELHDRLVEAFRSALGPDHLETITALAYQATILRDAGQYARARAIEEHVVQARARVLGEEHPDTLLAKNNLASTLAELGKFAEARAVQEEVLEARIRVQGKEHPDTLATKSYLAGMMGGLGELALARALYVQVVEARVRVLGEEHPDTLLTRSSLASTLADSGELAQARALQEEVLEAQIRVLGEEHPDTLQGRSSLASMLADSGELAQARALQEQMLQTRTRLLGEEHPTTLDASEALAKTLRELGELDKARAIEEQVLAARGQMLGEEHLKTVKSRATLAMTLHEMGELDQAKVILEQVVRSLGQVFGEEHSQTISAKAGLAATLLAQGKNEEAISLMAECLEIALGAFGKKHPVTTEAAWRLVESCEPHETARKRALVVRYLSWMGSEQPSHLNAQQKKIKEGLKGSVPGKKHSSRSKKRPRQRKKKHR